ncbi:uncharacterized protein B0H64DRAFT_18952 [Chaetomium fimeti]|uniref:BZIP domain-containing protein n=1 Tax=Chaetomium fimeti TaxID=1854472 RepID=A0AAE0HRP6_9PEZI|nr:hypothetical protein B0H64DRAFT_18952 [Chaetomium fimeti]
MEQPQLRPPGFETEKVDSLAHSYPPSHDAIQSLAGWTLEQSRNPESMAQFQQLSSMPMGWLQGVSATAPTTLDSTTVAGQQYIPQLGDWHQVSSFGYIGVVESAWSRPNSVPWDAGTPVTANNRQVPVDVTTIPPPNTAAYPPQQAEAEPPVAFLPTHWQNDDLARHRPYQVQSTSGYNFGSEGRSGDDETWGGRKPRQSPILTKDLYDADHPRNRFTPLLLRRVPTSDVSSHTTSPPHSATALSFNAPDASYLSDTTTTSTTINPPKRTRPRRRTPPTTPSAGNHHHHDHDHHNPTPPFHTQTPTQNPAQTTTARNRNRAAASRYRAKTQAASARLEAAARAAAARHRALRARAGRLRDEVVRLKHELLARHAGCDCLLIRGYLEGAARRVCGGL